MPLSKYRWTCPICGESRVRLETGTRPRVAAENDLLSHVRSTRGDGHGSRGRCPDEFARADIDAKTGPDAETDLDADVNFEADVDFGADVTALPRSGRPATRLDEST